MQTYRSYIFDNSGSVSKLVSRIYKGAGEVIDPNDTPNWVMKYLIDP